jgi:hypothetical protein
MNRPIVVAVAPACSRGCAKAKPYSVVRLLAVAASGQPASALPNRT